MLLQRWIEEVPSSCLLPKIQSIPTKVTQRCLSLVPDLHFLPSRHGHLMCCAGPRELIREFLTSQKILSHQYLVCNISWYVYIYICICVYMCVCMCVHTHIYIYMYILYIDMYICVYIYTYIYIYVCVYTYVYIYYIYMSTYVPVHVFMFPARWCSSLPMVSM